MANIEQSMFDDVSRTKGRTSWLRSRRSLLEPLPELMSEGTSSAKFYRVRAGTVVGKDSTTKKVRPVGFGQIDSAGVSSASEIPIKGLSKEVRLFVVGDVVEVEEDDGTSIESGATITAVDYDNGTITIDATVTAEEDDVVRLDSGAEDAYGILMEDTTTVAPGAYDEYGEPKFREPHVYVLDRCRVKESEILGLNDVLKAQLTHIIFEED